MKQGVSNSPSCNSTPSTMDGSHRFVPLLVLCQVLAHIEAIATQKYRALQAMNPKTFISGNESIVDMNWQSHATYVGLAMYVPRPTTL